MILVYQIKQLVGSNDTFHINFLEKTIQIFPILLKGYRNCPFWVLSPLMLLMYVNDMLQAVKSNLFLYAGDTCLVVQGKDLTEIGKQLNETLIQKSRT